MPAPYAERVNIDPATIYDPAKLRAWRAEAGERREHVAVALGFSATWLKQVENAERMPSLQLLTRLAEHYGHTLGDVLVSEQAAAS
jgi:transcriptional regulator with XRE-family HTH domain